MAREPYRRIEADRVELTAVKLADRVTERFPGAGLAAVAAELVVLTRQTAARARTVARPYYGLRLLVALVIAAGLAAEAVLFDRFGWGILDPDANPLDLAQGVDSAFNLFLMTAAGAWFLLTLEARWKRLRLQTWLNELRAFAHVVDMHQLTKDPTAKGGPRTTSSPDRGMGAFELTRYLDYCAEILALTGKLTAIYAGVSPDHLVIAAAGDVENLCSDLNRKIWQKITILAELKGEEGLEA
ncbi:hypothetical protein [Phenylobacterium aquaticum]|uniref:hypothetical protein n=1 Tax=Phenylobacterium aquaticum TaxID=1763816 RepID=UPI0026EEB672|nr:hypothetical protein [Phenylobacterium aquaticum]